MIAMYGPHDKELYRESSATIWSCRRTEQLKVYNVTSIISIVAMVPHVQENGQLGGYDGQVFVVEKLGLDVMALADLIDTILEDTDEDIDENDSN